MIHPPKTKAEAAKYLYNRWAGNAGGWTYDPRYCAYQVTTQFGGGMRHQCCRWPGRGPDALYCKQHAKKVS